jgi:hypothetical protein
MATGVLEPSFHPTLADKAFELRPNPGPELLPPGTDWFLWGGLAGLGFLLLLMAAYGWRRMRLLSLPPRSPDEIALTELAALQQQRPNSSEELDRWHVRLADILRRYLNERFQCRPIRQTTPEWTAELAKVESLSDEQRRQAIELLERTDLVKFGRAMPGESDVLGILEAAKHFVQSTKTTDVMNAVRPFA